MNNARILLLIFSLSVMLVRTGQAQTSDPSIFSYCKPAPVGNLRVYDNPDDAGGEIRLTWDFSADDKKVGGLVSKYIIMRSEYPDRGFKVIGKVIHGSNDFINRDTKDGKEYYYQVIAYPFSAIDKRIPRPVLDSLVGRYGENFLPIKEMAALLTRYPVLEVFKRVTDLQHKNLFSGPGAHLGFMSYAFPLLDLWKHLISADPFYIKTIKASLESRVWSASAIAGPASSSAQWFNLKDLDTFIIGMIICLSVAIFIALAKGGRKLFLRKIGGLQAIDEAIGRATEMGKSILFIPGIQDMDDVQTVAAITILGRVARTIAEYDTKINMPVSRSIVMTTARETIKEAYLAAGRPEAYSDDMVHYLTDEQFGYVAAVDGIMVREKPATCFYLGAFFAESLIMAETGNSIGAIQIAGTAMPAQLPFFVAACDYTLIGEELFAASAYLSGEPKQLGSLKGQDVGKVMAIAFIIIGTVLVTLSILTDNAFIAKATETFKSWFSAG